jgi:hypothetical protein
MRWPLWTRDHRAVVHHAPDGQRLLGFQRPIEMCDEVLIGGRRIAALHRAGLGIGTGFINSPRCLYRELARGIGGVFSDRALELQRIVARGLART